MLTSIHLSRSRSHQGNSLVELRTTGSERPELYELRAGIHVGTSGNGKTLLYSDAGGYGLDLDSALRLGWCHPAPKEATSEVAE